MNWKKAKLKIDYSNKKFSHTWLTDRKLSLFCGSENIWLKNICDLIFTKSNDCEFQLNLSSLAKLHFLIHSVEFSISL